MKPEMRNAMVCPGLHWSCSLDVIQSNVRLSLKDACCLRVKLHRLGQHDDELFQWVPELRLDQSFPGIRQPVDDCEARVAWPQRKDKVILALLLISHGGFA